MENCLCLNYCVPLELKPLLELGLVDNVFRRLNGLVTILQFHIEAERAKAHEENKTKKLRKNVDNQDGNQQAQQQVK